MKIRYTKGPDDLTIGDVILKKGEWKDADQVSEEQALLPARVAEYGFEVDTGKKPIKGE